MIQIIRSINYEIIRRKNGLIAFTVVFVGLVLISFFSIQTAAGVDNASQLLSVSGSLCYVLQVIFIAYMVSIICAADFREKVEFYEIMSGHSRLEVCLARGLYAVFVAAFLALILAFVPMIVGIVFGGWGDSLALGDVIVRQLLLFFPFARYAAFCVLLSYLVRNEYIMLGAGFLTVMMLEVIRGMMSTAKHVWVSYYNMVLLTSYEGWSIYNVDPTQGVVNYTAYQSTLTPRMLVGTPVFSLLMIGCYLLATYGLFRKNDME